MGMGAMLVVLLVTVLAVARITRLVTFDKVAEPFREWTIRKNGADGWFTYLVFCPYCMAVWVAAAVTPFAWFFTDAPDVLDVTSWFGLPITVLAVAYTASLIIGKETA